MSVQREGTSVSPESLEVDPTDRPSMPRRRRGSWLSMLIGLAAVAGVGAGVWYWSTSGQLRAPAEFKGSVAGADPNARKDGKVAGKRGAGAGAGGRAQPVSVGEVRERDIPVLLNALGTITPRNIVTVRSRVEGELLRVHFQEGQLVSSGQLLAEIDPRPFQVALAQASGQLARDTALLNNARVDLERYQDLWAKDSIARQQVDTQQALVAQYQGAIQAGQGQVDNAKLQLSYTRITAPISGRAGLRQVDAGNVVRASDPTGLVVITQVRPITAIFSVPEVHLRDITARLGKNSNVGVEAWDRDQKQRIAAGRLLTTDNQIDVATGTIKLKAEFPNDDASLFPNQFINVRLQLDVREKATVVPAAALLRGAQGTFVYVVAPDGTVSMRQVKAGPGDGDFVSVQGEVQAGERVVTDGADKLRDGMTVEVIAPSERAVKGAGKGRGDGTGRRKGSDAGGDPTAAKARAEPGGDPATVRPRSDPGGSAPGSGTGGDPAAAKGSADSGGAGAATRAEGDPAAESPAPKARRRDKTAP